MQLGMQPDEEPCACTPDVASPRGRRRAKRVLSLMSIKIAVSPLWVSHARRGTGTRHSRAPREISRACAHGEINNKNSDTPGRGRPSRSRACSAGRFVDCACAALCLYRSSRRFPVPRAVSQSVISRTHPALTPPPALNPAPMEGSTRLSVKRIWNGITQSREG